MPFYGDIGWFYLSARDLLTKGSFPLVGITSSHIWLHQGPFWTYFLSIALWLGRFDPVAGGYLAVIIGIFTVITVFWLGRVLLSYRIGIIAAILYSTSPLVTIYSRTPYHTTPIPLFACFYFLGIYYWYQRKKSFVLPLFFLAILYNFELATVLLSIPFIILVIWRLQKNTLKIQVASFTLNLFIGLSPLLPVVIYDFTHGFRQTLVYGIWLIYTPFKAIMGMFSSQPSSHSSILAYVFKEIQTLIFFPSGFVAIAFLGVAFVFLCTKLFQQYQARKINRAFIIIGLWFSITMLLLLLNNVASDAYFPQVFPVIFLILALLVEYVYEHAKWVALFLIIGISLVNVYSTLSHSYFEGRGEGISLEQRENVVKKILSLSDREGIIFKGEGDGSQFRSFTMPYEYLTWYYRPANSTTHLTKIVTLTEKNYQINVKTYTQ
ncbi:MAG TPA: glycosyltransferase family 39 protein [Patescibacteria group bacterium]|nr:glycosyltransferase family 39 protein [Patescibacteria group bacterium]